MKKQVWITIAVIFVVAGLVQQWIFGNMMSTGTFALNYFAAGDYACGVFAAGKFSIGIFSIGIFSVGIFSLGIFNIGLYAVGFFLIAKKKRYPKWYSNNKISAKI